MINYEEVYKNCTNERFLKFKEYISSSNIKCYYRYIGEYISLTFNIKDKMLDMELDNFITYPIFKINFILSFSDKIVMDLIDKNILTIEHFAFKTRNNNLLFDKYDFENRLNLVFPTGIDVFFEEYLENKMLEDKEFQDFVQKINKII